MCGHLRAQGLGADLPVTTHTARGLGQPIAQLLSRDVKTVERHINNIYGKLQADGDGAVDARDRRVHAALTYLRGAGILPTEQLIDA